MSKRFHFDVHAAIPAAWDLIWKEKRAALAKGEDGFRGENNFTTASDVADVVRQFASDVAHGRPFRTKTNRGDHYGIRMSGDIDHAVRSWLMRQPDIARHNFGRGHISGMRFRPSDLPSMTETEKSTMEAKKRRAARPAVRHFGKGYGARPQCSVEAMKKKGRGFFGRPSKSWVTTDREKVTCPRCLSILKTMPSCEAV